MEQYSFEITVPERELIDEPRAMAAVKARLYALAGNQIAELLMQNETLTFRMEIRMATPVDDFQMERRFILKLYAMTEGERMPNTGQRMAEAIDLQVRAAAFPHIPDWTPGREPPQPLGPQNVWDLGPVTPPEPDTVSWWRDLLKERQQEGTLLDTLEELHPVFAEDEIEDYDYFR